MSIARRVSVLGLAISIGFVVPAYPQNTTTRVSVATSSAQSTEHNSSPAISGDGRYVAFVSAAPNLVANDTNGLADVFVHDRDTGTTERVNLGPGNAQATGGFSGSPSISADGRFVAFVSLAANLVANDTNKTTDAFVRDRQLATTIRISVGPNGAQPLADSSDPVISADGRYIAFTCESSLVSDDTNGQLDIYRYDRVMGAIVRVSVATGGAQAIAADSVQPSISADGRVVTFVSAAANLVSGDTNGKSDVFARDVVAGTTTRISVGPGSVQSNDDSREGSVSGDGRFVTFSSSATNLDAAGGAGIFVHDRQSGVTSSLSVVPQGSDPGLVPLLSKISGNGRYVCFSALASPAPFYEVIVLDRQTLAKTRVSVAQNGEVANAGSSECTIAADGTVVAYTSVATNLVTNDTNDRADVFVRTVLPTVALDKTALTFAAVTSGTTFVSQTPTQTVRLTQDGSASVTWSAASNQPWLQVSPASGTGSATLSLGVIPAGGLPPSGTVTGTVFISVTGAANTLPPIAVSLTLVANGTSRAPFGVVDTPADHRTGVTGAVPFTGWALDDIDVVRVSICRAAFGAEVAPVDPNCGGAAEIFVGFAVFIDGARPDVAAGFSTYPQATRAGWGFMTLTNMLPDQGNGQYRFTMRAQDREGTWVVLGTRTMTCANASATLPFGTLDTPLQGGVASGSSYPSFGWALTPLPKTIPIDGSTIQVLVDGVVVGTADYNHARPDIQALFPGFNNTNGAIGFRILDTAVMTNGLHTISWTVTDNQGAIEGIGSRFFTVSNGTAAVTASASSTAVPADVEAAPLDTTPLVGRRGWDLEASWGVFGAGATGATVIRSEEVNRVEVQLGAGNYTGYVRTPAGLAPLPIGSRLDAATNTFTWAPGVGFVGRYDLVFVRSVDGRAVSRRDVRIILHPKGSGSVGPQVVIDVPGAHATVQQPFMIGGWAVDLSAATGTGVTTLHARAYPSSGGAPIFLGATVYGGARPDVAAVHGDRFKDSGFGLIADRLPAGDYDLALFPWSTEQMNFVAPTVVRVNVRP